MVEQAAIPTATQREKWRAALHAAQARVCVLEIGAGLAIPTVRKKTEGVIAGAPQCAIAGCGSACAPLCQDHHPSSEG